MTPQTTLVIHLGYHKTGSSSIQKWLLDHAVVLKQNLHCYNLADGSSNPLKFAVHDWLMKGGSAGDLAAHCRAMAEEIRNLPQATICITDESLLGMPPGYRMGNYVETGIYPRAREVVEVMAREFVEFNPVFVVFERESRAWLRSVHNQMYKQGCVTEDFDSYLTRIQTSVDWQALRAALTAGIGSNGRLVSLNFEAEFALPMVADMGFFRLLDLPAEALAMCRPELEQINRSVRIRPATLQALVLGGSNSMIANGWVNLLLAEYASLARIANLSVGACTSAMALYRLISHQPRKRGVPVIWEYGINEYNHMIGGQPLSSLIYHTEWLLQICIRENRPFVPVLMRGKEQAISRYDDVYVHEITSLFHRYGLTPVDCNLLLRNMMQRDNNFDFWYADAAHYSTATRLPRRIAEAVLIALDQAEVPRQDLLRAMHFDPIDLVLQTPPQKPESFKNSVVNCHFARFEDAPEIALPGRALAAIIVTSGSGPNISLNAAGTSMGTYATQIAHGPKIPPRQLRQLVFGIGADGIEIPGGQLRISVANNGAAPLIQNMFTNGTPSPQPHANGVAAILCEKPR